ncbi:MULTISPECIES: hypothetical protein [unclassified Coleofasciculus]|uniref:hypothetical protein n=1 Tax=unclassified Coleofasciculus TaxID=2692782 RepID=UPI0018806892|nr:MULTISPECIES: hypothetical protein [unclassified Coleofasciculus]MBE9126597.1 hypothetical protein [Coleofasciculus sp. LEGE 07081]MBE9149922.1 hypothetical protein [Coleofasciculus sp. LEGE 07092]
MLYVNRRRFKCENCQKPFSENLEFVGNKKLFTHRYAHGITKQVTHSDVINVSKNNKLTEKEVEALNGKERAKLFG